ATRLALAGFDLPVRDVTANQSAGFFCPGSIVRLEVNSDRPLGFGMPSQTAAFFAFSSAYETAPATSGRTSGAEASVETIARYGAKDVLLSGFMQGEQLIAGRGAVVTADAGAGHIVMLGFPAQHRGQSIATFRLLFNAILS